MNFSILQKLWQFREISSTSLHSLTTTYVLGFSNDEELGHHVSVPSHFLSPPIHPETSERSDGTFEVFQWKNEVNNLSIGIDHWHIRKWIFNVLFPFCQKVGNSHLSWLYLCSLCSRKLMLGWNSFYVFSEMLMWGRKGSFYSFYWKCKVKTYC